MPESGRPPSVARVPEQRGPVLLRATTLKDLPFILTAEQDADSRQFIIPWSAEQHATALGDSDIAHLVIEQKGRESVGFVIVAGLTNAHASLEFRRIVVSAKGKGIGRAAVRLVKQLAFAQWHAHRLWLDVKQNNLRARRLYESEGFAVEGLIRECLRGESGYESLIVMSMLEKEHLR